MTNEARYTISQLRPLLAPGKPEEKTGTYNFFIVDTRLNG
jgi:hypothetical protein